MHKNTIIEWDSKILICLILTIATFFISYNCHFSSTINTHKTLSLPKLYLFTMKNFLLLSIFFFLLSQSTQAQDKEYAHQMINQLGSEEFGGRGYVDKGVNKAAKFIEGQFESFGLESFGKSYAQPFGFPINTIQRTIDFSIDGKDYKPGDEYLISCFSNSFKGTYDLVYLPDSILKDKEAKMEFYKQDFTNKFVVIPGDAPLLSRNNELSAKGIIILKKNLVWVPSQEHKDYVVINMVKDNFPKNAKSITLNFKSKFYPNYKTQNTIGYIKGSEFPDSFIMISAHYDHIGRMGQDAYFPGANDNASGTAMMLNLAKYYSEAENKPKYSVVFMSFSGEEVGILGSLYYVKHPLFSLERIKFLVNLDMVGTGSKGITVVNGSVFKNEFARMQNDNKEHKYIARVKVRGEACNSDHCPFYMMKVPSFFIYTFGDEYSEYHNVTDSPKTIPLTAYDGVFKLMRDFIDGF